jgi:hypothetical protein
MADTPTLEAALEARCEAAGLVAKELYDQDEDDDGNVYGQYYGWTVTHAGEQWSAHLRAEVRPPADPHEEGIAFALSTAFEYYHYLGKYEGVWSARDRVVEAEVELPRSFERLGPVELAARKITKLGVHSASDSAVRFNTVDTALEVEFGYCSKELLVWRTASPAINQLSPEQRLPVLRIRAPQVRDATEAVRLLETYGLAALIELNASVGQTGRLKVPYPMKLRLGARDVHYAPPSPLGKRPLTDPGLLYLHALSQNRSRATRFMSFYHVLEFFFPRFSFAQEANRMKTKLAKSSPQLSGLSEDDLIAIIKTSKAAKGGERGFGDEKEQMRLTVNFAISADELRAFISSNEEFTVFYKNARMPLVTDRVPVNETKVDLRRSVADRLYAIRNRIVHKKESKGEVLLPSSPEFANLYEDLEILELLARNLVESTAVPLT